ncbi:hypothetical protein AKJ16_DCAP26687 [Drosera capensis]
MHIRHIEASILNNDREQQPERHATEWVRVLFLSGEGFPTGLYSGDWTRRPRKYPALDVTEMIFGGDLRYEGFPTVSNIEVVVKEKMDESKRTWADECEDAEDEMIPTTLVDRSYADVTRGSQCVLKPNTSFSYGCSLMRLNRFFALIYELAMS